MMKGQYELKPSNDESDHDGNDEEDLYDNVMTMNKQTFFIVKMLLSPKTIRIHNKINYFILDTLSIIT